MAADDDPVDALRRRFAADEKAVPTSRLGRLWKTGRSAAALGAAVLGGRLRGRGDGLAAADLDAIARLTTRLGELKGVAMKAGQILGYVDVTLPDELRGLLSLLQTQAPATPFARVEATLREALGARAETLLAGLERAPVAVASIGQVHRGRLPGGVEVAVKVRHPGIVEAMQADLKSARSGSAIAAVLLGGAGTVKAFVDEAAAALLEECDYRLEAENQSAFVAIYAGHPTISVPAVERDYCAAAVLTTRWLAGRSLDAFLAAAPAQPERDRIGEALFDFYVGTLYRHGLFHADPHPGNYGFLDDGRIAVYDYGCVRRFAPERLRALARLVSAVRRDARVEIEAALAGLGARPPDDERGWQHVRSLLRAFLAPLLHPGRRPVDAGDRLDARRIFADKRALARLDLPGELLFVFRLRFGLYAVLSRLGAIADWAAVETAAAAQALRG